MILGNRDQRRRASHVAGQTETLDKGLGRGAVRFGREAWTRGSARGASRECRDTGRHGVQPHRSVQPDAKVVVAGSGVVFDPCCSFDAYVARYSGESVPDTTPPVLTVPSRLVACNVENESAFSYHAECSKPFRGHGGTETGIGIADSIANAGFG